MENTDTNTTNSGDSDLNESSNSIEFEASQVELFEKNFQGIFPENFESKDKTHTAIDGALEFNQELNLTQYSLGEMPTNLIAKGEKFENQKIFDESDFTPGAEESKFKVNPVLKKTRPSKFNNNHECY